MRLQEHVVEHGRGSVQLPAEQVEAWTATSDGGFRCAGRAERIVPCSVADTLVPELCTMRLFACLTARTHLPHCARLTLAAAINSRPSSFGSAGIVALSATCKWYAGGLKDEVRRATSIVLHPHAGDLEKELYEEEPEMWGYFVAGAPGVINDNIAQDKGLVNGTRCTFHSLTLHEGSEDNLQELLIRAGPGGVGRQSEAAWLLAPVGGCRFSYPRPHPHEA